MFWNFDPALKKPTLSVKVHGVCWTPKFCRKTGKCNPGELPGCENIDPSALGKTPSTSLNPFAAEIRGAQVENLSSEGPDF